MRVFIWGMLLCFTLATWGCRTQTAEGPAQPTAAQKSQQNESTQVVVQKPIAGEADQTFSLSVPFESISLAQGQDQTVLVGINRGPNFREEVVIKATGLPEGVTIDSANSVIKPGSTGITLVLKATSEASLGDFTITITGHTASSGDDFSVDLKLTVKQP
ncbi:MAG TPA: hypothetical protein PKD54_01710 [Pirellulaceae bacterium]|nr:hypothetical protein [Pirellulaceae bacterium]